MATIHSYTTIEQSKVLAKILPFESADMHYHYDSDFDELESIPSITEEDDHFVLFPKDISCWSLAALLDILPKIHGAKPILDLEENSIQYTGIDLYVVADNPVDACVAMIEKLHELKKHYLDTNNNYRCELKKYPESNIIRGNWGQWEVDADKCNNYKVK